MRKKNSENRKQNQHYNIHYCNNTIYYFSYCSRQYSKRNLVPFRDSSNNNKYCFRTQSKKSAKLWDFCNPVENRKVKKTIIQNESIKQRYEKIQATL